MKGSLQILGDDHAEFMKRLSSAGVTTAKSSVPKPTASLPQQTETSIPTRNQSLLSNTSSRCALMETHDSLIPPVEAVPPSEPPVPSAPAPSLASQPTP